MSDNPIKPKVQPKRTPEEWVERGNRLLAGVEPTMKGEYLTPRHDVHWILRNGVPTIEFKYR